MKPYILVADGACSVNPGPGGWGLILVTPDDQVFEFGGHEEETTNNRMELTALYRGMQEVYKIESKKKSGKLIHVITDSKYVLDGASKYVANWSRSAWRTSTGSEVKNRDLWEKILKGFSEFMKLKMNFEYELVRGHSGHDANERCDQIAVAFSKKEKVQLYSGTLEHYSVKVGIRLAGDRYEPVYLSLVGGQLSRHSTWEECQETIAGVSGAKFKKVKNRQEEEETLKLWGF